jgi:hypothetical protein
VIIEAVTAKPKCDVQRKVQAYILQQFVTKNKSKISTVTTKEKVYNRSDNITANIVTENKFIEETNKQT